MEPSPHLPYQTDVAAAHGLPIPTHEGDQLSDSSNVLQFPGRQMDLVDGFVQYTSGLPTPTLFRKWAGISAVAGALERRVWVETAGGKLYPNLFVLLVAPPGVGKSVIIQKAERLWNATKKLSVAPHNFTKAALVDQMAKAMRNIPIPTGLFEFASLNIAAGELGNFISSHDLEFLSAANYLYDNPDGYRESKRMFKGTDIDIINPSINLLAGTQPGFLGSVLPEEAWSMGTTSRMLMIYAAYTPKISMFAKRVEDAALERSLVSRFTDLTSLIGEFTWTKEAAEEMENWYSADCPPIPRHSKLTHYIPRRMLHTLKLCIVASASRASDMSITIDDVERAKSWILEAERLMPDIFRDMQGKSDIEVIKELHQYVFMAWVKSNVAEASKRRPIHVSMIVNFLSTRVPSEKIPHILRTCENAGILIRMAGEETYRPKPMDGNPE